MSEDSKNKFLDVLLALYLCAETDIVNEIARLRALGLVDYHAEAALERVQGILQQMQNESFSYIPQMVEREFYVNNPSARRIEGNIKETVEKHLAGYRNALSIEEIALVEQLSADLSAKVLQASQTVQQTLTNVLVGRREPDIFVAGVRQAVAYNQVMGLNSLRNIEDLVITLQQQGVTAFVDKAGHRWSLHTYLGMATRTTRRQAEITAVLTADPEHDLYKISSHNTVCPLCAPYEGRVYSRSGRDPDFPPLAAAFGKIDPNGADDLSNTWLNIHSNCLHVLMPWTDAGMTEEEIAKVKEFSSFASNPPDIDPRTEKQRERYREQERKRRQSLDTYKQWARYRLALGDKVPKNWQTFARHKLTNDEVYKNWLWEYRLFNKMQSFQPLIGQMTSTGIEITGISQHFVERAVSRNFSAEAALNALQSPLKIGIIKMDENGGQSQRFTGVGAAVVINPVTGKLITGWRTKK